MSLKQKQDEMQRRTAACVNAFEGIPTERIAGKNLGEILAGEMRLHGAGPRADGGFGFEFSGGVCQLLAEAYAEQFKQSGAINYLELLFQHSEIGPLTITMQRVEGLTPAQKLAQAEAQRDALAAGAAPEGYVLVPQQMHLSADAMESLCFHCGDGGFAFGDFTGGLLWVGDIENDDGSKTYGLNIATAEYPEEGSANISEFAAQLRAGKDGE